jgi:predicted RNase H-like HicB family nuclease
MIRRTATGYSVDVPDVPGCIATGMTVEHARQQIAEALEGHLEVMRDAGESTPAPASEFEFSVDDDAGEEYCSWVEVEIEAAVSTGVAVRPKAKRKR